MPEDEICIRTINENIQRVFNDQPLTMPLRRLNHDCRFKKMYDAYCDIKEGDLAKEKIKEYSQRPEVKEKKKEKMKEYMKEYYQRNKEKLK